MFWVKCRALDKQGCGHVMVKGGVLVGAVDISSVPHVVGWAGSGAWTEHSLPLGQGGSKDL